MQKRRKNTHGETIGKKADLLEKHPCFKQMVFWTRMPDYAKSEYLECVRIANQTMPADARKKALAEVSEELRIQYEKPMVRTSLAFINLARFLRLKGLQLTKILKEAQISEKEFKAMEEIGRAKHLDRIMKRKAIPTDIGAISPQIKAQREANL